MDESYLYSMKWGDSPKGRNILSNNERFPRNKYPFPHLQFSVYQIINFPTDRYHVALERSVRETGKIISNMISKASDWYGVKNGTAIRGPPTH